MEKFLTNTCKNVIAQPISSVIIITIIIIIELIEHHDVISEAVRARREGLGYRTYIIRVDQNV